MNLKNNIKVIGTFQNVVNALYTVITVIRIVAVLFLILQTVVLLASPIKANNCTIRDCP